MKTYMTKEMFKAILNNTLKKYDYSKKDIKDIIRKLNVVIR